MSSLANIAAMATATDPVFDQRLAAALTSGAVTVLSTAPAATDDTPARVAQSRRRSYSFAVIADPMTEAARARWVLAAALPAVCDAYNTNGQAGVTDAQLGVAVRALWDALAEA